MATVYDEGREVTGESSTGRITLTKTIRISPYSEWKTVMREIVGGVNYVGGRLVRVPGLADRDLPFCFADSYTVTGIGPYTSGTTPSGLNILYVSPEYTDARCVVVYTNNIPEDIELLTETWDFAGQALPIKGTQYGFIGNNAIGTAPSRTIDKETGFEANLDATITQTHVDYTITRHGVQSVPANAIGRLQGRVNKSAFTLRVVTGYKTKTKRDNSGSNIDYFAVNRSFPAETLRFDGAMVGRKTSLYGVHYFEIAYKFSVKNTYDKREDNADGLVGWQRLFKPRDARYERVALVQDPNRLLYKWDEDVTQTIRGKSVSGFNLLFNPKAT